MITPGVSNGPAPLMAAEAGMAVTGAACAEALKRNHRTLTLAGNIGVTTDGANDLLAVNNSAGRAR
jgi:hypothetical protein